MPKALIIDDSGSSRTLLKGILSRLGVTAVEAKEGSEGLVKLAEAWPLELILLDWHMEPMDGPEFLKQLRADERFRKVPVMVITAEASRDAVTMAAAHGIIGYIVKPFDRDKVSERIKALGLC